MLGSCKKSRMDKIPNWAKSRIGQNLERTKARVGQNPELGKTPNEKNPELDKNPELNLLQKQRKSGLVVYSLLAYKHQ